jgi:hypothetical protein
MERVGLYTEKTAKKHNLSALLLYPPSREERKRKTTENMRTGDRD